MLYKQLRMGALVLLTALFLLLSNAVRQTPETVMVFDSELFSIQVLTESIAAINTIEYKQSIKTGRVQEGKNSVEMHYYYKKPNYLRAEIKSGDKVSVDIYTPEGMYEYFPLSNMAYYREKWKDESQVSFQLDDKLQDIKIGGKFELLKMDRISGMDAEVIRSVDDEKGNIYEHKIWLAEKEGLKLPVREEFLTDGEVNLTYEYEYISINKDMNGSLFQLKPSDSLKINITEGIPKLVKDEKEAEKFVKFNVLIPEYTPKGFIINEIFIIPPAKTPSVLISYLSGIDMIYFNQKNIHKDELSTTEVDKVIKVGSKRFAVKKLFDDSLAVRWVKEGIEFEISGSYTLKDEVIKLVHDISGIWISIE